ncbi:hypothetical protein [Streptomyces sp. NPDC006668]|uniref:DUF7224 domain-containing protein n=1 Tax=Streptomyces sp. NPDC006668 TaxID=3156903 RepID=UPI0033FAAEA9
MVMFRFHPRANAAVLAAPLLLVIVLLYVFSSDVSADLDGYWTAATAKAASALMFIGPVTAACAAWEAGRLRRARIGEGTPIRNGWQIAAAALVPIVVLGVVALAVALAGARLQMQSAPGWPDARIILSAAVILCAHILAGYAVGMWLPAVAAVPVVLVGDYLWNVYPPALQPLWLRHLTQPAFGCCLDTSTADIAGITGPAVLAVGLAALAMAAAAASRHTPRLGNLPTAVPYTASALAVIIAVATTAGSVSLVDRLGPDAIRARPASDLVCATRQGTRVCVWPEHTSRLNETARTVSTAVNRLRVIGVSAPSVVTESRQQPTPTQWTVTVKQDPSFTRQDILSGLISDLTVRLSGTKDHGSRANCPANPSDAAEQAFASQDQMRIWLTVRAGMSPQDAQRRTDPQLWAPVARVLSGSLSSQENWFHSALARAGCMPR